jgi:hypothetical protein
MDPQPTSDPPHEFLDIFGEKGDSLNWLDTMNRFPNGVPRFESRAECLKFMKNYNRYHGGSNREFPQLKHIFTTLISWDQVKHILLPAIAKARKEPTFAKKIPRNCGKEPDDSSSNIYEQSGGKNAVDAINFRFDQPIQHKCSTTPVLVINTMKYLFFHMKCGIYVMICNGKVRIFAPFTNSDYHKSWSKALTIEGGGTLGTSSSSSWHYQEHYW